MINIPAGGVPRPMRPSIAAFSPDNPKFWKSNFTDASSTSAISDLFCHHFFLVTKKKKARRRLCERSLAERAGGGAEAMVDWRDGIAGGVSGVTTRFFVAPLDVIKIRLQLQVISKDPISKASSHVKYQGVLQTLGLLVREGWRAAAAAALQACPTQCSRSPCARRASQATGPA